MNNQPSSLRTLCVTAAFGFIAASPAVTAQAQTQQWSAPSSTGQWSSNPGAASGATGKQPNAASGASCPRGAKVEVLYGGQWYPAKILDGPDRMGTCLVAYDGYGSNWDEWVNLNRIRGIGQQATNQKPVTTPRPSTPPTTSTPTPGGANPGGAQTNTPPASASCARGAKVEVLYAGKWYPAKILDGPDRMGTCLVAYDGYGSNWDEWVNLSRIRGSGQQSAGQQMPRPHDPIPNPTPPGTSTPPQGGEKPVTPPTNNGGSTQAAVPTGTYACYTNDSGQLNYTYTDIVVHDGSRYSVGNKEGRYTLSASGSMTFTGPLSNAKGTLARTTKPQINLIFNGNAWSSMACAKSR